MQAQVPLLFAESLIFTEKAIAGYLVTGFFTLVSVVITYYVFSKFLFGPINKMIEARKQQVGADLDKAKEAREKAEVYEKEAQSYLYEANKKATDIIHNSKDLAENQASKILEAARMEASDTLARAEKEAAQLKQSAYQDIRKEMADLSLAIASKVIATRMDSNKDRDLVEKILDEELASKAQKED